MNDRDFMDFIELQFSEEGLLSLMMMSNSTMIY